MPSKAPKRKLDEEQSAKRKRLRSLQTHTRTGDAQPYAGSIMGQLQMNGQAQVLSGPSTSHSPSTQPPRAPGDEARPTVPKLRRILPAPNSDITGATHNEGSAQGWNNTITIGSKSAFGAGKITNTNDGNVATQGPTTLTWKVPVTDSTSLKESVEEDAIPEEEKKKVELVAKVVPLYDPYDRRAHQEMLNFASIRDREDRPQESSGCCNGAHQGTLKIADSVNLSQASTTKTTTPSLFAASSYRSAHKNPRHHSPPSRPTPDAATILHQSEGKWGTNRDSSTSSVSETYSYHAPLPMLQPTASTNRSYPSMKSLYGTFPLSSPPSGNHISRYSSLADALSSPLSRPRVLPSTVSLSSVSNATPSSQSSGSQPSQSHHQGPFPSTADDMTQSAPPNTVTTSQNLGQSGVSMTQQGANIGDTQGYSPLHFSTSESSASVASPLFSSLSSSASAPGASTSSSFVPSSSLPASSPSSSVSFLTAPSSSSLSDHVAHSPTTPPSSTGSHYQDAEVNDAMFMACPVDIGMSAALDDTQADYGARARYPGEGALQPVASNIASLPLATSSSEFADSNQLPTSEVKADTWYSPMSLNMATSLSASSSAAVPAVPAPSIYTYHQDTLQSMADNALDSTSRDTVSAALYREGSTLQTVQQGNGAHTDEVHSLNIPLDIWVSPSLAPSSPSPSLSKYPAIPIDSLSTEEPRTTSKGGMRVYDPSVVVWLVCNVSSAFFAELVDRSFLLSNPDDAATIRMLREVSERHSTLFEEVDSLLVRHFREAIELWGLCCSDSSPMK